MIIFNINLFIFSYVLQLLNVEIYRLQTEMAPLTLILNLHFYPTKSKNSQQKLREMT